MHTQPLFRACLKLPVNIDIFFATFGVLFTTVAAPTAAPSKRSCDFDGKAEQSFALALTKEAVAPEPAPATTSQPTKKKKVTKKKKPTAAKTATLKIGVAPGNPPATVYVDGKKQSKKTPVFVKVAPGKHTVKWVWGGKSSTQRVSVGDGESKLVKGKK